MHNHERHTSLPKALAVLCTPSNKGTVRAQLKAADCALSELEEHDFQCLHFPFTRF